MIYNEYLLGPYYVLNIVMGFGDTRWLWYCPCSPGVYYLARGMENLIDVYGSVRSSSH